MGSYFGGEYQSVRGCRAGLWVSVCFVEISVRPGRRLGAPGFPKSGRVLLLSSQQIRLRPEEDYSLCG